MDTFDLDLRTYTPAALRALSTEMSTVFTARKDLLEQLVAVREDVLDEARRVAETRATHATLTAECAAQADAIQFLDFFTGSLLPSSVPRVNRGQGRSGAWPVRQRGSVVA